jgi:hypothetical protein
MGNGQEARGEKSGKRRKRRLDNPGFSIQKSPTACFPELFEVNDQSVVAGGRHNGLISTLRLLSIFCLYADTRL